MPRTSATPRRTAASSGVLPAGRRVVVGQRDDVQPRLRSGRHELGRRLGAVAGVGVGVEVDAHVLRLGQRGPALRP